MVVFISQTMRGKTYNQIQKERKDLVSKITALGHTVYDSVHKIEPSKLEGEKLALWHMGKSIQQLSYCDAIFFLGADCLKARGCLIELECAKAYGLKICTDLNDLI